MNWHCIKLVPCVLTIGCASALAQTYGPQAYLKPSDNARSQSFGTHVALDGDRLAVGTVRSKTYLFERSATGWREAQIIEPLVVEADFKLALSGDTLVLGWQRNDSADASDPSDRSLRDSGAARLFVRNGLGTYVETAFLKSPSPTENLKFGESVSVDGDVMAIGERGFVHVYERTGGTWAFASTLPQPPGQPRGLGRSVSVSGDRILAGAQDEESGGSGVNSDLSDSSLPSSGAAYVYVRSGNAWKFEASLKASNPDQGDKFGALVALSDDIAVVTAPDEASSATGVNGDQTDNSLTDSGATYVFERNPATGIWGQTSYLKRQAPLGRQIFHSLAVDEAMIAIGTPYDLSGATSVNGDPLDTSTLNAGSVQLYHRTLNGWVLGDYLKAPNAGRADQLGISVAVSGNTVVAGANQEAGGSRDINLGLDSNDAVSAGATYVFTPGGEIGGGGELLPEVEFNTLVVPEGGAPVSEYGTAANVLIERTLTTGPLTIRFQLSPFSQASFSDILFMPDRDQPAVSLDDNIFSITLPSGLRTARLRFTAAPDPTDLAETDETAIFTFVPSDDYTINAQKNVFPALLLGHGTLVTNTEDSGTGSLRQALINANANPDLSTVTFSDGANLFPNFFDGSHRTISLASELLIDEDTVLVGPGKCFLTITGNSDGDMIKEAGETRVFRLSSEGGGGFDPEEITLRGLTIRDGIAQESNPGFGSTENEGGLVLVDNRETIARIEDCSLIGGRAGSSGGAVSNDISSGLTIVDCEIVSNRAGFQGGAVQSNSRATIYRCRISGNSTSSKGGAIYIDNGDNTVIRECLISNNTAHGASASGGGIFVDAVTTIISDCLIEGNRAIARYDPNAFVSGSARGGGINYSTAIQAAPQLLINTTIANNTVFGDASASGGGIYVFISPIQNAGGIDSPFRIHSCTIIGNCAEQSGLGLPFDVKAAGGGIYFLAATPGTLLDNCTITGNLAEDGSGISILNGQEMEIDLYQSIISGNIGQDIGGTDANNRPSPRGRVASAGYNIIGTGSFVSDFSGPGDQAGITDPGLTPLRYDGGRFPTYSLRPDSPAREAGDPNPEYEEPMLAAVSWIANLFETDQRRNGFARTVGARTDIGAIEFNPFSPPVIIPKILSLEGNAIEFTSIPGRTYTLEVSPDLSYFIRLDKHITATSTTSRIFDFTPNNSDPVRFYRVTEIPPPVN